MIPICITSAPPSARPSFTTIATIDLSQWDTIGVGGWRERVTPIAAWIHLLACAEAAFDDKPILRTIWITDQLRDFREDVATEVIVQLQRMPERPYMPSISKQL